MACKTAGPRTRNRIRLLSAAPADVVDDRPGRRECGNSEPHDSRPVRV